MDKKKLVKKEAEDIKPPPTLANGWFKIFGNCSLMNLSVSACEKPNVLFVQLYKTSTPVLTFSLMDGMSSNTLTNWVEKKKSSITKGIATANMEKKMDGIRHFTHRSNKAQTGFNMKANNAPKASGIRIFCPTTNRYMQRNRSTANAVMRWILTELDCMLHKLVPR